MKNLLNNLSQSEKNRILEQYNNSLLIDTSKFKKLLESKLGDIKPLIENREDLTLINEESTIPFKNNNEGNRFRKWVNDNYPIAAKELQLDREGAYNNYYIQKAWNYFIDAGKNGETLGDKYIKSSNSMTGIARLGAFGGGFDDSPSQKSSVPSKIPFKNNTEGNEFRKWVNNTYPSVAKEIQLDKEGLYNNYYIQKAWSHKVGNNTLGEMFTNQKNRQGYSPSLIGGKDKISTDPVYNNLDNIRKQYTKNTESESDPLGFKAIEKRDIELKPASSFPQVFKGSGGERLNKEVFYIKSRSQYKGKPFFVIDPRMKIVAAFDSGHNLVKMSQTVEGKDTQRTIPLTYEEWCKTAKGQYIQKKCSVDLSKNYSVLGQIHAQASSPGIYKGSGTRYEPGYTGKQNVPNLLSIKTLKGNSIPMAIHALVPIQNRVEADATLKKYLSTEKELGRIPEAYTKLVTGLISSKTFDLSAGCFNVDPNFINDPKVLSIANSDPYIFVMSEQEDYYLVQVEPEKGPEFFQKLGGDGDFCKPPSVIGVEVGGQEIKTA